MCKICYFCRLIYDQDMKIGYFILKDELREDARMKALLKDLEEATFEVYEIKKKADVRPETDLVLSMGGDGYPSSE